ncbi:MAG: hypothetical protein ACFE8Z_11430 [Candidatus Hermodarchaeota archaeon]
MDPELLNMLNSHKSLELENAASLKAVLDVIDSSIVKMFLGGIMLDSTKHSNILQTIIDINSGEVLWNIDKQKMVEELEKHLEIEKKMLQSIQDIVGKNKDEKIEPLIEEILADERRHHRIFTQLLENVDNLGAVKEEWLDFYLQFQQEDFGRT